MLRYMRAGCSARDALKTRYDVTNRESLHMVNNHWLRRGVLVCGLWLAVTVPAYAEPAASPKPTVQIAQSLAISGTVTMAPSLASKGSATDTLFVFARETNGPP